MPPPLIDGALNDAFVWRLTSVSLKSVCLSRKSGISREQSGKTKHGTEVAHITRDSDTTFKVKGQGHQAALLTAVLARKAAAAVGVKTCWPWETAVTLPSARRRKALRRPRGEERGAGITWRPPAYSLFYVCKMIYKGCWTHPWYISALPISRNVNIPSKNFWIHTEMRITTSKYIPFLSVTRPTPPQKNFIQIRRRLKPIELSHWQTKTQRQNYSLRG